MSLLRLCLISLLTRWAKLSVASKNYGNKFVFADIRKLIFINIFIAERILTDFISALLILDGNFFLNFLLFFGVANDAYIAGNTTGFSYLAQKHFMVGCLS